MRGRKPRFDTLDIIIDATKMELKSARERIEFAIGQEQRIKDKLKFLVDEKRKKEPQG